MKSRINVYVDKDLVSLAKVEAATQGISLARLVESSLRETLPTTSGLTIVDSNGEIKLEILGSNATVSQMPYKANSSGVPVFGQKIENKDTSGVPSPSDLVNS